MILIGLPRIKICIGRQLHAIRIRIQPSQLQTAARFAVLALIACFVLPSSNLRSQEFPITALAETADGNWLAGSDSGLALHEPSTLKRVKFIPTKLEKINSIRVSPDGKTIAVAGGTPAEVGSIELLKGSNYRSIKRINPFDDVATDVLWITDQRLLTCSMTGNCASFSMQANEASESTRMSAKGILSLAKVGSDQFVSGGLDQTIRVRSIKGLLQTRVLNNHVGDINQIATRPIQTDSKERARSMVVSVSDDGTVRFWQPEIGRMVRFTRLESIPTCVVWDRTGTLAIVGTQSGQIFLVDPQTSKIAKVLQTKGWIHCMSVSRNNASLIVGTEHGIRRFDMTKSFSVLHTGQR